MSGNGAMRILIQEMLMLEPFARLLLNLQSVNVFFHSGDLCGTNLLESIPTLYKTQRIRKLVVVDRYYPCNFVWREVNFVDEKTTCAFSDWTSAPRTLFSLWEEIVIQKMSEIIHVFNFQTSESPAVGSSQCSLSLSASDSATPKNLSWFFFSKILSWLYLCF